MANAGVHALKSVQKWSVRSSVWRHRGANSAAACAGHKTEKRVHQYKDESTNNCPNETFFDRRPIQAEARKSRLAVARLVLVERGLFIRYLKEVVGSDRDDRKKANREPLCVNGAVRRVDFPIEGGAG